MLSNYGIPVLLLTAFIGSLGIPFPITLVIMAAGASAHAGLLDPWQALLACLAGASLADHSEYLMGWLALPWLRNRFGNKAIWNRANDVVYRQGGWAIFLTRFWFTPLAPVVNVLSGGRYPYPLFLLFDLSGELMWVLLYGGMGYLFAAQWQQVSRAMSWASVLSMALVLLGIAVYFWMRRQSATQPGAGVYEK